MSLYQKGAYAFGPIARSVGAAIDKIGVAIEGSTAVVEKLRPPTRVLPHKGKLPKVPASSFIAPTASVIGDVELGAGASVWYGAVVRGDVHYIKVGEGSSIGDGAVVHVAKFGGDLPTHIGRGVTVGPKATVHACTLEDGCVIGAGATVMDGATVSKGAVLAAGALAPPRCVVPAGQVWAGTPAAYVRDVTSAEAAAAAAAGAHTARLAASHAAECAKPYTVIEHERLEREDAFQRDPEVHHTPQKLTPDGRLLDPADVEGYGTPGRVFSDDLRVDYSDTQAFIGDSSALARTQAARRAELEQQAKLGHTSEGASRY